VIKLYSYYRSSSSYRVRIVLAHKRIPYDYVAVNLAPSALAQERPEYEPINALRQVPVLEFQEAGGVTRRLTQSVAIAEYLEQRWPEPPLLPDDPWQRAKVREAVQIVNSGIQPLQNARTLRILRELAGAEVETRYREDVLARGLSALEAAARALAGGRFFAGDQLSLADVFLVPQLYNARRFRIDLGRYPRLCQLERAALAEPAFQAADPARQPDAPRSHAEPQQ
jgi:maleylpyruvate isomerase